MLCLKLVHLKLLQFLFPEKPNITSNIFRIGYITRLSKDSKDIEFVKQTIGHQTLNTNLAYINQLSDQERRELIPQLDQTCPEKGLGFNLSPYMK